MKIIERLKIIYYGHISLAKVEATRALGRIRIRKSEPVINFQARFNNIARQVKAAGGHKDKNELIDLYLQGVNDWFPWWVMATRTIIRGNKYTLMDIQNSLFEEDY